MSKDCINSNNEVAELIPYRIIPVDIGYKIDLKHKNIILDLLKVNKYDISTNIRLFGENAVVCISLSSSLSFYLFADGVGVFAFEDIHISYSNISKLDADHILSERKNAHRNFLEHTHCCSADIDKLVELLRSIVKVRKRRLTSHMDWERQGLSYVMSFYFLNADRTIIEKKKFKNGLVICYLLINIHTLEI